MVTDLHSNRSDTQSLDMQSSKLKEKLLFFCNWISS